MKKLFVLVFAIALCLGVLCLGASADYSGTPEKPAQGDGTVNNPYKISSAENLYWFAGLVNGGEYGANAELTANITINENVLSAVASSSTAELQPWTPIGNSDNRAYTGTFYGDGHTISGLYYDDSGDYAGLFGYVGSSGRVQNVNIADSYISNNHRDGFTGGVCGDNNGGTITNCYNTGTVKGLYYTGGVCGDNGGMITNCSFSGSVTCNNIHTFVGGVCGGNTGTIENSYNAGTVTSVGSSTCLGGVCGYNINGGTITNCYNTGAVNGENTDYGYFYAGGVCGFNDSNNLQSTITNCYNTGSVAVSVTGSGNGNIYAGGVCGSNDSFSSSQSTITNCYNTGSVTGSENVGGVCGYNGDYSTIDNCYNTGDVTGSNNGSGSLCVGGVCGYNDGTITNCYNTDSVTGSNNGSSSLCVGGVCGYNYDGTITNCYWLSGKADGGVGSGSGTATNVKSKTAEEFASGEVAWLLNQGQTNDPWRQTLGADDYPVLDNNHKEVVKLTVDEDDVSYHNKGYRFSGVEGIVYYLGGKMVELPYTVEADTVLTTKTLYVVTVDGVVSYVDPNEPVFKLPAAPSKSGYTFVHWSDGTNTYDPGDSVPITGNVTFTAVWQAINIPDPNGITVTQPANGTIRVNPSNGSTGTLITVTATPDEGYELAYITVDGEKITGNTFRMPDKAVTVTAVFVPIEFPFTDVTSGDWFYDAVAYVYANGLMDGTSATTFEPNANMTRAMVWAILARVDGETVTGEAWSTDARAWAMAEGVSDGTDPNGLVTREQFATMLYRYAVAKGYDVSIGESTNILSYADFASISEYAIPAMQWACGSGIVTGVTDSTLAPQGTATRAQCAAMLMRFVEL